MIYLRLHMHYIFYCLKRVVLNMQFTGLIIFLMSIYFNNSVAVADNFDFDEILPPNWSSSFAHGNNDNGDVVGYGVAGSATKAFLYSNGLYSELIPPGWSSAYALRINSSNEIVGYGRDGVIDKGFIYHEGTYRELLPPGWDWAWGIRNNDNGDVVGGGEYGSSIKAFLFSDGSYSELLPPGWTVSFAFGINNFGEIVGNGYDNEGVTKAFKYSDGTYTEIIPPGWTESYAYGINNEGEIVGNGITSNGDRYGYHYHNGIFTEIVPPGWNDIVLEDINDNGDIAGYGNDGLTIKGFIYRSGAYIVLLPPDVLRSRAIGINNAAQVVGRGYNTEGSMGRGFAATPCQISPVRIIGSTITYYSSLQDAYDAANDGSTIESHDVIFQNDLLLDLNKRITMRGGYNCDYSTVRGTTTLIGNATINDGTVDIQNFQLE